MFNGFYHDKRVLVTGHTGFKGAWLSLWLHRCGAIVHGLSLPAPTHPNLHEVLADRVFTSEAICDIRNGEALASAFSQARPEVVFHLAAQPLVRRSYAEPLETFQTNALGTANLLECIRRAALNCVTVIVTSDKCYENREWDFAYREDDPMGGHDIYSMSKGAAELLTQAWNRSFFLPDPRLGPVATARAGNVIGGGDYAEDRIVPDCVRALTSRKPILVRNPMAVRPWQHVLECLSGYLWLGARLAHEGKQSKLAGAFNFGPQPGARQSVRALVEQVLRTWPGEWVDGSNPTSPHEAKLLSLAIDKAVALLGWRPVWDFDEAVNRTMAWYYERHVKNHRDLFGYSCGQIDAYTQAAREQNLAWTA